MAVASSVHKKPMVGRLPLDDIHWEKRTISGITAYGYSKVCNRDNTSIGLKNGPQVARIFQAS